MSRKSIEIDIDDERTGKIADVISNKTSKKILNALADSELSESELAKELGLPMNTVGYNVKKLLDVGLIEKVGGYLWSVKGKRIRKYKVANKRIVISPRRIGVPVALIAAVLLAVVLVSLIGFDRGVVEEDKLKTFSSYSDLENFLEKNVEIGRSIGGVLEDATGVVSKASSGGQAVESAGAEDFSGTNVQVEGVDEPDIVKNDGKYIYSVSGTKIVIVDAFPAKDMEILSEIEIEGGVRNIFVNDDKLIVFSYGGVSVAETGITGATKASDSIAPRYYGRGTSILIYDISDKKEPKMEEKIGTDGEYVDARLIGKYVYVVSSKYINYREPVLPMYEVNGVLSEVAVEEVYYFDYPDRSFTFTSVMTVDVENGEFSNSVYLTGGASTVFVSEENIYIAYQRNDRSLLNKIGKIEPEKLKNIEKTVVHKIGIDKMDIDYEGYGEVPGKILNQFSMGEHKGYFRIATTTGDVWDDSSLNHIYVLDEDMEIVGNVEDLAVGERIYSARFLGDRAYLVTFKKVDPFYVIDLSDPKKPEVLGFLKIPGFSDYLHPYDENHIIGIGKNTVEAANELKESRGIDFAWYQGLKISVFDVTDVENPKESAKIIIGDRGTDSYALRDHKAFLFDKERGVLVIPVSLAKIDESKYSGDVPINAFGETYWQGAMVLDISEESISERGRISHYDTDDTVNRWYYGGQKAIQRSLYMDDILYTISQSKVQAHGLDDIEFVNGVDLLEVIKNEPPVLY